MSNTSRKARQYWPPYTPLLAEDRRPQINRGDGIYLYDNAGRRYIDGISGSYNHCLGHSNRELMSVIKQQLDTLVHACNMCTNTMLPEELSEKISKKLVEAGISYTFLVMSGSEGVETALKMAWQYQINQGRPQRTKIVAIKGAYHGCTLGAMIATRRTFINEGAGALFSGNSITMPIPACIEDLSTWATLLEEHRSEIAAIIVEPIMGMEGTRQLPKGFLQGLSTMTKRYDIPLICDEVYCGIGRVGTFCESVDHGARPEIVIFSKCLGGGFPITAVVTTESVADSFNKQPIPLFRHGHTQSGNLLGCRAALFILEYLDKNHNYESVKIKGANLLSLIEQNLPKLDGVLSAQGKGLMLSITFDSPELCSRAQVAVREYGIIVGAVDKHLKLAPAFTITDDEMEELAHRMIDAISNIQAY